MKSREPSKPLGGAAPSREPHKKTLTPKLRFPQFRDAEGWARKSGDSLFDQINDRNSEPGLPVLAITQEHGAIPRDMIDYHVSVTEKSIESYKVVRVGDFIISLRSFQGGIEYSQYHGICSPAYVILRRRIEGSDAYFKHYLKTDGFIRILTKNLEGLRDGKMISYRQFSELLLPIPAPSEQQKIADCLSSVDELIAAQARQVDALKTHKKALMQQLFPREGETVPRLRFPEFRDAGEWEEMPIGEKVDLLSGYPFDGLDISQDASGTRLLRGINITEGYVRHNPEIDRYYLKPIDHLTAYCVQTNDLVIGMDGSKVGKNSALISAADSGALLVQRVARLRSSSPITISFVFQRINSPTFHAYVDRINTSSGIPHISAKQIREFRVLFPSETEQHRIASCLSSLDDLIAAQIQQLAALKIHKQGLMQQLFPAAGEGSGAGAGARGKGERFFALTPLRPYGRCLDEL